MGGRKNLSIPLSNTDKIDITLGYDDKRKLNHFVLNYRGKIEGTWQQIYRIDTCHDYLHQQKFWISSKPEPIKKDKNSDLKFIFDKYLDIIKRDHKKYRRYYLFKYKK